jgi:hypothetical protein
MGMRRGERWRCGHCGCEIQVTHGEKPGTGFDIPRCSCGHDMQREE